MVERFRAWLLVTTWALGLGLLGPIAIPLTVLTKREEFITLPATAVIRLGAWLTRLRVAVIGRERLDPNGVYVYTSNHQSLLDGAVIWSLLGSVRRRPGLLMKKELRRVPILGYGLLQIGGLIVDRSNPEQAKLSAQRAAEKLRGGRSFLVFLEGTRTRTGDLLPFKKGAFHMAIDGGVPIVPITLDGFFQAMPPSGMRLRSHPLRVTIHEPVPTAGLTADDIPALMERVRETISSALDGKSEVRSQKSEV